MSLAFWNNPIVVSAFRIKYRRGGTNAVTFYMLLLVLGGALLHHYQDKTGGYWPRNYFMALIGLQLVVSALTAVTGTSTAMKMEVTQRTLDFQRIAALSPRQILLGKLLGEPAQAYLLAIATIPIAVFCWLLDAVSLDGLVLMYVQLFTTTLMFGSMGLITRLDGEGRKSGGRGSVAQGLVIGFVLIVIFTVPALLASGMAVMNSPWAAAVIGLTTPLPIYYGIFKGNPWLFDLSWFGLGLPFALVTPLSQLLIAYLSFQSMVRQLINPLNPALSKGLAYVVLAVVDLLAAGILWEPAPTVMPLGWKASVFCLIHLLASLGLTIGITAWRETLHSWVWRFRGQGNYWRDLWLGNRSENVLALLTFCALAVVGLMALVVVPAVRDEGLSVFQESQSEVLAVLSLTVMLILVVGTVYQWFVFLAGRNGAALIASLVLAVTAIPHLAGHYYQLNWLLRLCPSYYFGQWLVQMVQSGISLVDMIPFFLLYGAVLVFTWSMLRRHLSILARAVDRKLILMGAMPQ
jgi:hypothetical protein